MHILNSRNHPTQSENATTSKNTPSLFIQASITPILTRTTSLNKAAQSDNSVKSIMQIYPSISWDINMPLSIVTINRAYNDTYPFGNAVWVSTGLDITQHFPDLYLNLGSFTNPSFTSLSSASVIVVEQFHIRFQTSFIGPIIS